MQKLTCIGCAHYFITYQPQFPYGCKAFGIKSKKAPHMVVFESSGKKCEMFTAKK